MYILFHSFRLHSLPKGFAGLCCVNLHPCLFPHFRGELSSLELGEGKKVRNLTGESVEGEHKQ